jgi:membrane protease YdiL (CAAX protease family)
MTQSPSRVVLPRIGLGLSIVLFGLPALWLWVVTGFLISSLVTRGWAPLLAWFAAGSLVFVPMLVAAVAGALWSVDRRSVSAVLDHLRVHRLTAAQWRLTLITLLLTLAAIGILHTANASVWPKLPPHPPFMTVEPLAPGQYFILAVWLPFFFFNVVGEELWWRGFIQPRQEPVFGRNTWIVQGLLHGAFHVSFGGGVLLLALPAVFAIPFAVQRTQNTSAGMVIHAGVNGPGFVAVSLGLLPA